MQENKEWQERNGGDKVIMSDIKINDKSILRVTKSNYNNVELVSIRKFIKNQNNEFAPTKKGISFKQDHLDKVIDALINLKDWKRKADKSKEEYVDKIETKKEEENV